MKKKLLSLLLCVVMVAAVVCVLVACETGDYDYEITVWVGEGMKELTAKQIKDFNNNVNNCNPDGKVFKATIQIQSESNAAGAMNGKPASDWPDIYCFAQDQMARLVTGERLQQLNGDSIAAIQANSSDGAIAAATVGDTIRAFPLTADNGFIMYYNKDIIDESKVDITSLEELIAACESAKKYFAMNLAEAGGAWYSSSFFYAAGCHSEWTIDEDGKFTKFDDTFNSANGLIALQGMKKLLKSAWHLNSDKASTLSASTPSAVVISGVWDLKTAQDKLGKNLGIAKLPSYTVDGQTYNLQSYLGYKFMGIKPQSNGEKSYYLQQLVTYLTGTDCQKARFDQQGWGPSDKSLVDLFEQSEALKILKQTATIAQGQYPEGWWVDLVAVADSVKKSKDDSGFSGYLENYYSKLSGYVK